MSFTKPPGTVAKGFTGATTASGARANLGTPATTDVVLRDGTQALTGNLDFGGFRGVNGGDPLSAQEFVTKAYADNLFQGASFKLSCRAASTVNLTLSGTQTIDGVAVLAGERVLAKNQSTASQNGSYLVAAGAWTRTTDFADANDATGSVVFPVEEGTANAGTIWLLNTAAGYVIGSTSLSFIQLQSAGSLIFSNGLNQSGNTITVLANGTTITVGASGIKVSDTYAGNGFITSVGSISVGVWNGTKIDIPYGGTNATSASGARTNLATAPNTAAFWLGSSNGELSSGVVPSSGTGMNVTAATGVIAVDTTVVATTNNTLTMSGKTLTSPILNSPVTNRAVRLVTGTDTLVAGDSFVKFTISSGANATLPASGGVSTGRDYTIKNAAASTANVTVQTNGTDKLENNAAGTYVLSPGDSAEILWDGVEYSIH